MPHKGPPRFDHETMRRLESDFKKGYGNFDRYDESYDELIHICEELEKLEDSAMREAGKNYIIIRLFTIFDVEAKAIVADLIDNLKISPSRVLKGSFLNVKLDYLEKLLSAPKENKKEKEISIGQIMAINIPGFLTNPYDFSDVFSGMNDLDFFPWLAKITNDPLKQKFQVLWDERNGVVHNMQNITKSNETLKKDIDFVRSFLKMSYIFTTLNLVPDEQYKIREIQKIFKGTLTPEKFNEITKEFREKKQNSQQTESRTQGTKSGRSERREQEMHKATCTDCGNECEVPFIPEDGRPVYCHDCFPNHKTDRQ